jgi:cytoskeletal protein CcmA (bactofilin family)
MADSYSTPPVNPQRQGGGASVLDRQVSITGSISSDGAIRIEGRVDGDVAARSVTLAEGATINGGVVADVAIIEGSLNGPLHAREARLTGSAHMKGEIVHSVLVIEAGAQFDGQCRRDNTLKAEGAFAKNLQPAAQPVKLAEKKA